MALSIPAAVHPQYVPSAETTNPESPESTIEKAAPWVSSLLMHTALALIAAFVIYAAIRKNSAPEPASPPVAFPLTANPDEKMPSAERTQDAIFSNRKQLESMQNVFRNAPNGADPFGSPELLQKTLSGLGDKDPADILMIAKGTGGSLGHGSGLGAGDGPGAPARFGPAMVVGAPNRVLPTVNARRVVYLLDHSGSMLDSFDYLRQEVKTAAANLRPFQQFSVIMFSEDVTILGPDHLQRATPDVIRDVARRLESVRAQGQNDGLLEPFQNGFEKAFAMKPDVIIFLTDGQFDPRLVNVVGKLNQAAGTAKVRIYTIAYVQIEADAADNLKKIAADAGGTYKFVSEKDLAK